MLSNQCLITLPEVRTKGLVPIVRHTRLRLSVNKVEGHISLTMSRNEGVIFFGTRDGIKEEATNKGEREGHKGIEGIV